MLNSTFIAVAFLAVCIAPGAAPPLDRDTLFQRKSDPALVGAQHHWAFGPVKRIEPPTDPTGWSSNPIDCFILAALREHGLTPAPPADKRTLIRRASFDLVGLPPSPEEVEAFVADKSPDAYSRLIDQLLASPRYGERWGRHWMDVVRYADTAGDNADYPIPEIHLYRDYIIDSFNADKPYDQFVREQLAGDVLAARGPPEQYPERVIATGFIALSRRYATAPFELWHLTIEDTIETTGRTFLGLTLRCARCHDHKYDPVTKEDYYGLYGIFASTQYPYAGSEEFQSKSFPRSGFIPLVGTPQAQARIEAYQAGIRKLQAEIKDIEQDDPLAKQLESLKTQMSAKSKEIQERRSSSGNIEQTQAELALLQAKRDQVTRQLQDKLKPLRADLSKLQRPGSPQGIPVAYAVRDGKPADVCVQIRGNPEETGPVVKRAPPKFLTRPASFSVPEGSSGRLELAQWLTTPDHPLTARVMINRIWQHHFGKGIVTTPSNFGLRGEEPTHPQLLDYLASRFVECGWSIKAMHRLIMLSKTYQLAGAPLGSNAGADPGNKWYGRFPRRRLDAEAIRDAIMTVAGTLNLRRPEAHPFPPIASWTFTQHAPFKAAYASDHRSVYLMTQRIQRHPYLALFDGPDPNTTTEARTESTIALQALFMMNNPFVQTQAEAFAKRLIAASPGLHERICLACKLAWSRLPGDHEVRKATAYLQRYREELNRIGAPRDRQELEAWTSYARVLLTANEFVYID